MNILIAAMLAQSLWGELTPETPPTQSEEIAAPYAAQNVEANEAVLAATKTEEPKVEEPKAEEPKVEEPKVEEPNVEEEANILPAPAPEEPAQEPEPETKAEEKEEQSIVPSFSSFGSKLGDGPRSVKITSERTDYDRREGVIMFDKNVFVDDEEYKMHSDQLYVFLDGTNDLKRIVAIGNVAITNETRHGSCAKAAYTRSLGKIVMYGDGNTKARLTDEGKHKSEVEGKKITFWITSEQVEVEGSTVTLDAGGFGGKEGAKKLLGK
ncbi:MAG: hypothetical protein IJQ34_00140 [Kiritimatiellae bacterium]|nr:hypothetical protein [Kiritimatiellia bacterium]